jgi:N-acetylglutamate synthase
MHSIRPMTIDDYDAAIALMQQTPGISLRDADSRAAIARYLERNPGLSFVAESGGQLIGCVMCGHDGRRGYLQHLVVQPAWRRRGIAGALIENCLGALERLGIVKCHVDVIKTNPLAAAYWNSRGWTLRTDIDRYSLVRSGGGNV